MKLSTILIWLAILLYVGSFFPMAVKDARSPNGVQGYFCAWTTLTYPWGKDGLNDLHGDPLQFFGILLSGWINPLFLIFLLVRWLRPAGKLKWILSALLLVLFPACWVVFAKSHVNPAIGYFLWTGAQLLALISGVFAGAGRGQIAAAGASKEV